MYLPLSSTADTYFNTVGPALYKDNPEKNTSLPSSVPLLDGLVGLHKPTYKEFHGIWRLIGADLSSTLSLLWRQGRWPRLGHGDVERLHQRVVEMVTLHYLLVQHDCSEGGRDGGLK